MALVLSLIVCHSIKSKLLINSRNQLKFISNSKLFLKSSATGSRTTPLKFKTFPFKYHEIVEITIENLSNLGLGVGRKTLIDGSHWVIMVPLVLPGEVVLVKIYKNHATYSEGDLVEILKESPERVIPKCKYFSNCGGCQYQHMTIDAQRRWKKSQVESGLQRIGGFSSLEVNEVRGSEHLYGYRSKLTPHYNKPVSSASWYGEKVNASATDTPIGFLRRGSKAIVDVEDCVIATDSIRAAYATARSHLHAKVFTDKELCKNGATLLFREGDGGVVETDNRAVMQQTVEGVRFRFKAGEFFQNNPFLLAGMVRHVLQQASQGDPPQGPDSLSTTTSPSCRYLIDAYCGSGLFSLTAAHKFEAVYGVELSALAVEAATRNAEDNGIKNTQFISGQSEAIFAKVQHLPRDETVIIIDPPRKGCDVAFLSQLFAFGPKKVVYVSCDPATQARDAKIMVAEGGYRVTDVTPFDLFPQTRHIENVMTFCR